MRALLISLLAALTSTLRTRASPQIEILELRHQLSVLQRSQRRRVALRTIDRLLWISLARLWPDWRKAIMLVKPQTVISWHRKGFRSYWKWKSRRRIGRPGVSKEIRDLIPPFPSSSGLPLRNDIRTRLSTLDPSVPP